jgi:hypothetical protein
VKGVLKVDKPCSCGADKQKSFRAEIVIHHQGMKGLEQPAVFMFPDVVLCLNCGKAQFEVPPAELQLLA